MDRKIVRCQKQAHDELKSHLEELLVVMIARMRVTRDSGTYHNCRQNLKMLIK